MLFCPKCGSLMKPGDQNGKKVFRCTCGHVQAAEKKPELRKETFDQAKEIEIVGEEENVLPIAEETCPKCGHKKAQYWLVQTRAGDEAETKFFKCVKCKQVWRDNS